MLEDSRFSAKHSEKMPKLSDTAPTLFSLHLRESKAKLAVAEAHQNNTGQSEFQRLDRDKSDLAKQLKEKDNIITNLEAALTTVQSDITRPCHALKLAESNLESKQLEIASLGQANAYLSMQVDNSKKTLYGLQSDLGGTKAKLIVAENNSSPGLESREKLTKPQDHTVTDHTIQTITMMSSSDNANAAQPPAKRRKSVSGRVSFDTVKVPLPAAARTHPNDISDTPSPSNINAADRFLANVMDPRLPSVNSVNIEFNQQKQCYDLRRALKRPEEELREKLCGQRQDIDKFTKELDRATKLNTKKDASITTMKSSEECLRGEV